MSFKAGENSNALNAVAALEPQVEASRGYEVLIVSRIAIFDSPASGGEDVVTQEISGR